MSMKKMLAVVAAAALVAIAAPAFAANPFSDVPMNHWAYDAVAQLSSRGVISGYPDGTFKGNKAMTRYEIASIIARALANAEYASKEDFERLKALVVEFQPELEALGVTVDGFDKRISALEKGVGGWKLWGELRFDAVKADQDDAKWGGNQKWDSTRYRIWMRKQVNDKITFTARIGNLGGSYRNFRASNDMAFDRYYLDVADFLGMDGLTFTAGMYVVDWEGDDNMYTDWDSTVTDFTVKGLQLKKTFGMGEVVAFGGKDGRQFGARAKFNFNEKFWLSANAIWTRYANTETAASRTWSETDPFDANKGEWVDTPASTTEYPYTKNYWVSAGFNFMPGLALKGSYIWQKNEYDTFANADANVWKVILDIKQDVLKFTSLWVEYQHYEKGFQMMNQPFDEFNSLYLEDAVLSSDMKVWFAKAAQKWTDKWSTWLRYLNVDIDEASKVYDDLTEWGIGVGYQYSPQLSFELAYAAQKFDSMREDDNVLRFRTRLQF